MRALCLSRPSNTWVLAAVPFSERTAQGINGVAGKNADPPPEGQPREDGSGRWGERFLAQCP